MNLYRMILRHIVKKESLEENEMEIMPIGLRSLSYRALIWITSVMSLAMGIARAEGGQMQKKHVLVINSYHDGYRWSNGIMKELRAHFSTRKEIGHDNRRDGNE